MYVALCPPASLIEYLNPLSVNPVPDRFAWVTVILGEPELVNVTD
jgi:hypothetical protein